MVTDLPALPFDLPARGFGGSVFCLSRPRRENKTFMLTVTTPQHDGSTRATVTLPCTDDSEPKQVCLLQV